MKKLITILAIAILALTGYTIYLGLTKSENNNAGMIALDAGNLAQSVTDTFKDGANVLAEKSKTVAVEAKDGVVAVTNEVVQSVASKTVEIADSAKEKAISAGSSAKEGVANAASGAAKTVTEAVK